jgi:UPF0755 protein
VNKRRLIIGVIALGLLLSSIGLAYAVYRLAAQPLNLPEGGVVYDLRPGTSVIRIADDLATAGYLRHPNLLRVLAQYQGVTTSLKAGKYLLEEGMTPASLLRLFASGRSMQEAITFIEGWNFAQVLAALREHEGLEQTLAGLGAEDVMSRLGYPGQHPEGQFYPDTYYFQPGTKDIVILEQASQRLQGVLAEQWAGRQPGLPLETPYEALVLASIVEKETGQAAERGEIAGVFTRRLRMNMKLQTDPTVIYGLGERFDGNLRRRDLVTDTPYNTYVRRGLPPTPICMPGEASIHAALQPLDGNSLYFVSKGDGSHYFSATLEEHRIAVRRFQLKKK